MKIFSRKSVKYQELIIIGSYWDDKYLTKKYLTTASDLLEFRDLETHRASTRKNNNELD